MNQSDWQSKEDKLESIATYYRSDEGLELKLLEADAETIIQRLNGDRVLEMGCANGVMTRILAAKGYDLEVVEGSSRYIDYVKKTVGEEVLFFQSLFDEFQPAHNYDDIIIASVLEHVGDPVRIVRRAAGWLAPEGNIHVVVPNAMSLHRRLGVAMGILSDVTELTDVDVAIGHVRMYTPESLEADLSAAGLRVVDSTGILLKPLSNSQMKDWPSHVVDDLIVAGDRIPEWCAHLYRLCIRAGSY